MTTLLIDWLVEVHRKFKLLPASYFLAMNILDRYLAKKQVKRSKLQLIGFVDLYFTQIRKVLIFLYVFLFRMYMFMDSIKIS